MLVIKEDNFIDLDKVDEKDRDLNELRRRMSTCDMDEARAIAEVIFNLYPAIYMDVLGVEVGHLVEVSHEVNTLHTLMHNRKDTVYGKE